MFKKSLQSALVVFSLTFFSSLAVVGGGVLVASILSSNSFIQEYTFEDMDYTQEERAKIIQKDEELQLQEEKISEKLKIENTTETENKIIEPIVIVKPIKIEAEAVNIISEIKKYDKYFAKLKKRGHILKSKNERLEVSLPIDNVVFCLENMTLEKFKNFSPDPKNAFSNALGYCSFSDFAQQVQDSIDASMYIKKKAEAETRVHKFSGVTVPQYVIDGVLNSENWNKATRTLLGNQQNIYHDISYLNNSDLQS